TGPSAVVRGSAYSFTAAVSADSGALSLHDALPIVGTWSITASDGSISGSQSSIAVTPAAASHFVVNGFPSSTTAGVAHDVTVTATDAYGNTDTNSEGQTSIMRTDCKAVLRVSAHTITTGVSADNGVHQFSVTLETLGTWSIAASSFPTRRSSDLIAVTPAAASHFVVNGFPSSTTAGVAHDVTVTATDAYGNTDT